MAANIGSLAPEFMLFINLHGDAWATARNGLPLTGESLNMAYGREWRGVSTNVQKRRFFQLNMSTVAQYRMIYGCNGEILILTQMG